MVSSKWIICILVLFTNIGFGQNPSEKIPLTDVLNSIETKFDVKFSYALKDVSEVYISQPNNTLNLEDTIAYLNNNTLLNFKILDNRYITVSVIEKKISLCGIILTDLEKEPLFGVSILVGGTTKGSTSDQTGTFQLFDVPLNAKIVISHLGYESQQFKAEELNTITYGCRGIYLIENKEVLNQVIITKFLTTGLQKRLDGSVILNTEQFGILPGLIEPDILQSIQALPGVESSNESIANINVRGGTNDQNLMLWDNIKMYHSGHFFGLISAYNPHLTNKVIVTKNGTSSEYSDGVSSTVNMFTKDELTGKFSGGAGLDFISGDAFFQLPISKKLELHISGRRSLTDAFTTPTYTNYFERSFQDSDIETQAIENSETASDFVFYDYSAKLLFDLNEKHKFRVNVIGINNHLDYSEIITETNNDTESKKSNLSQENLGFGGNWQAQWTDRFSTKLLGYYSKYNVDADDYRVETDQRLTQANEVLETGAKLNTYFKVNENLSLLNGYQYNETGILNKTSVSAPSFIREKKDVLLNHAVFSEIEFNNGNTYARAGIRVNYFQKFDKLLLEPRLNVRQKLSNQFALKLEGEFKNQSATQIVDFQDDFLGIENRRWILANEQNIPISTSKQGSFGIEFKQNNFNIDITSFYKIVDGITASNQGFYNNFQFVNATGNFTAKGIEFLANQTTTHYSAWVSYTYSINDYEFETFTPSIFPNNVDIRHSVSLAFNYDVLQNLQLSVGGIWRSGLPYTKPVEGNETVQNGNTIFVNYDVPNGETLDDFMRLDASLNYKFNISPSVKASLRAGVRNLTDELNVINRYYEVDSSDSTNAIQIDNFSLGFTPNASMRITF
jgi:hypothetical protein